MLVADKRKLPREGLEARDQLVFPAASLFEQTTSCPRLRPSLLPPSPLRSAHSFTHPRARRHCQLTAAGHPTAACLCSGTDALAQPFLTSSPSPSQTATHRPLRWPILTLTMPTSAPTTVRPPLPAPPLSSPLHGHQPGREFSVSNHAASFAQCSRSTRHPKDRRDFQTSTDFFRQQTSATTHLVSARVRQAQTAIEMATSACAMSLPTDAPTGT